CARRFWVYGLDSW
nr:immunoglobulin heavy chain junction region [Macaca mulatta]MOV48635.1 immunoglobulin heavy chain junction region [Macaca mulatta]